MTCRYREAQVPIAFIEHEPLRHHHLQKGQKFIFLQWREMGQNCAERSVGLTEEIDRP